MKKIVSYLIIFALFITMFPVTVFAEKTEQRYTVEQMETIVNKYENNEDMFNAIFCEDSALGYWGMIKDIKQNKALTWALDMSSKLIGEYPEKQDYAEILANLITMQSGELAEQIETQSRFDDLKNIGDYTWDVVEIAASFVGASAALETISTAISTGVDGINDVIIKNSDQAKYYEATLQDYSQSNAFLSAVSMYADCEELRNVASSLLNANDTLLIKRLEYLTDVGENIAEYEAKFFVNNMSMELLKEADLYATDETVKWFVDEGINLKKAVLSAVDAATFAFKMMMLAGDIGFGTSDVYNRYQEMRVVADIADALVKANESISVPNETSESKLEIIQKKCYYYKVLLVTHARGEYLLYQLLMNDAGVLSDIRWIIEYFKNSEDTTDAWYGSQIEILTKYCDILDNIFVVDSLKDYVPNEERYKAYAEKIESYESEYGFAKVNMESEWFSYMTGLCFMKLVDFSESGQEELLLVYQTNLDTQYGTYRDYKFEIWGFENSEITMLDSGELFGTDGGVKHIYLTEYEGKTYLVTGWTDSPGYYYYHGYSDNGFGVVKEIIWEIDENGNRVCFIDGNFVSEDMLENEQEKWFSNIVEYNLNYDCDTVLKQNEETKQKLSPYYELKTESNNIKMTADEIYEKLVEHYKKGTEDSPGDELTVMEGDFYNDNQYETSVRCGVPGNASASQRLYEIVVDASTGEVMQTRVLTDNEVTMFNLNDN